MKTSHFSLCFVLFSIYTNSLLSAAAEQPFRGPNSLLSAAAEQPAPVVDTEGDELQAGRNYYILPFIWPNGGGVTLERTGNQTCPLSVVQEPNNFLDGLPLYFRPVNPKAGVVRLSTDQNIIFDHSTECVQSNVWRVDYDESIGKYVIITGGEEGNPGPETISNWFKIERYTIISYKLRFCPTVCDFCNVICRDVGRFPQDGKTRLVLNDGDDVFPFGIVFKKA